MPILAQKLLSHYAKLARILFKFSNGFLLAIIGGKHLRKFRPRILLRARMGQAGIVLQLLHTAAALTNNRGHAVVAGVATADDDNILILGINEKAVLIIAIKIAFRHIVQELLGKVNTLELASLDINIARLSCAGAQHHSVVLF